mmetsp:Transcript_86701/g.273500  ORF Transcript_86701/g.273500 Transcript_86701/m.273500 type:complete len:202 (+) Transcript_86701:25-630(+)
MPQPHLPVPQRRRRAAPPAAGARLGPPAGDAAEAAASFAGAASVEPRHASGSSSKILTKDAASLPSITSRSLASFSPSPVATVCARSNASVTFTAGRPLTAKYLSRDTHSARTSGRMLTGSTSWPLETSEQARNFPSNQCTGFIDSRAATAEEPQSPSKADSSVLSLLPSRPKGSYSISSKEVREMGQQSPASSCHHFGGF